ncbi:MAG: dipeptidyl peptidase 3 [Prevotellaceae bacterium]|jgi:dipeptidyl-peptidase-3|nr:dipeptidyl peptidase 3 [Prevotellaceae bacterium]
MKKILIFVMTTICLCACGSKKSADDSDLKTPAINDFNYKVDAFADMEILRYRVPEIEKLTTNQKELLYYLNEAALQGRDILFDQNGKYNLCIRRTLEAVYTNFDGDKTSDNFKAFEVYLKRVWVSNGIHHHYGNHKFTPEFSQIFFVNEIQKLSASAFEKIGLNADELISVIVPVIFDSKIAQTRLNQASGVDLIKTSASNYYENLSQKEVEDFYNKMKKPNDETPISYGLNSKLVKEDGKIFEKTYKAGGLYSAAIEKAIYWLEKAAAVAENEQQKSVIEKLISYYKSGDLREFDEYAILWVADTASHIDFINGFTETYGDPMGMKASWEANVNFKNVEATKRTDIISGNAQWFEDNSPTDKQFKKEKVKGIAAKVINVSILGGDGYPTTPIGINLPNSNWIRAAHGSKSVTIENITEAYDEAAHGNGFAEEFAWSNEEINLMNKYKFQTDNLHTDLHECLGHGSGKLLAGVDPDALQAYGATIEEARADLFGLYFMAVPKIVELGLLPNEDAYKAQYYSYFMNGLLTQQTRIELGKNIEEAHMRNRQLIACWVLAKSADDKAVELKQRDGETFVVINDYKKVQQHLGELLAEIQRIKSTGDFAAARDIVETYAVKLNPALHKEIIERYAKLNIAPYKGFVNPVYTPVFDENNKFIDLKIDYTENFVEQHLRYSKDYSNLPSFNN